MNENTVIQVVGPWAMIKPLLHLLYSCALAAIILVYSMTGYYLAYIRIIIYAHVTTQRR